MNARMTVSQDIVIYIDSKGFISYLCLNLKITAMKNTILIGRKYLGEGHDTIIKGSLIKKMSNGICLINWDGVETMIYDCLPYTKMLQKYNINN